MKKLLLLVLAALLALPACAGAEAAGLPAFVYQGDDPCTGAVCDYILKTYGSLYEACDVSIPSPLILEKDDSDPQDVKLWGIYTLDNYSLVNTTLMTESGGDMPGLLHLKAVDGVWEVTSEDMVGDGEAYEQDVNRIFGMRDGLADRFWNLDDGAATANRLQYVSDYVKWNGLNITQMQDFGWKPVALIGAPETAEADEIVRFTSGLGYSVAYDMRLFACLQYDELAENFCGVDALEGIEMDVERKNDQTAEAVVKWLEEDMKQPVEEEAAIGADGIAATCVRDGAAGKGVTSRNYVVPVDGGFLVLALSNTYYLGSDAPAVEGGEEALQGLLATFKLN